MLYAHQVAAVKKFQASNFGAILFEPGLGKTRTALELCAVQGFKRVLVLAPLSVTYAWEQEIRKAEFHISHVVIEGSPTQKKALLKKPKTLTLMSYDSVPTLLEELKKENWDALICDESTKLKVSRTLRFRAINKLAKQIPNRFILTGTPVTERVQDVWSQFYLLSPHILGTSFVAFRNQYCVLGGFKGKQIVGAKNIPHLVERIAPHSVRATKQECLDLPPKVYEVRTAPMSSEQKAVIKQLKDQAKTSDYATTAGLLTTFQRVTSGYDVIHNKPLAKHPKLEMLEDLVEEGLPRPVLIWCRFLEDVRMLEAWFVKQDWKVRTMTGDTTPSDRGRILAEFQDGSLDALIMTNVGGYGLNLQGKCTTMVFYSHWWSYEARVQAEDRLHRIGTTGTVTVYDLLCQRSVDRQIYNALQRKEDFSDYVMQNLSDVLAQTEEA